MDRVIDKKPAAEQRAKLRAEAAVMCSAAASAAGHYKVLRNGVPAESVWLSESPSSVSWLVHELGVNPNAALLASAAHRAACEWLCKGPHYNPASNWRTWAEAHALIECGFVPEGWR